MGHALLCCKSVRRPPHCACAESAAAEPTTHPTADDQYVTEQLRLMAASLEQDADRDQHEDSESDPSSSDDEGGEERGLEAFEDVLSSWLTAAHTKTSKTRVKAQASLPLRPRVGGSGGADGRGQSTLARIQEQQQLMMKEDAAGSVLTVSKTVQDPAGREAALPVVKASAVAAGGDCAEAAGDQDEEEEPESPTGIEGWKDVLSDWMTSAGVTAPAQRAKQTGSSSNAGPATKAAHQPRSTLAEAAEAPSWLADVSSDEKEEEAGGGAEGFPHRTSSISEQLLRPTASRELSSEADKHSGANLSSAQQQQPQHVQHGAISNGPPAAAFRSPSPQQGYSVPIHSLMGSSGVSSQDLRLDGDPLGRARSDPAGLWNNSAPGFPPRSGQEPRLPPPVATSVPAPVYPADQGLPPQVCPAALLISNRQIKMAC